MKIPGLTILDRYIIRKFLSTFFFTVILFGIIAIVFDVTEKLENFIDGHISLYTIVFVYYINFLPYIIFLLAHLFLFISVIFFTSRMASNSEIVAILSTGITFNRLLRPYFISALLITMLNIYANNWWVPNSNKARIAFEDRYVNSSWYTAETNIHMQVDKGLFVYMQSYNYADSSGYKFAAERFVDGSLIYKIKTDRITWDPKSKKWKMKTFSIRRNGKMSESLYYGKDTLIAYNFSPKDFGRKVGEIVTLNAGELDKVIAEEKMKGADDVAFYETEKYKRMASPFAILILTLIAVSLTSRKVRGGIGLHIFFGIVLSFAYILFQQFSTTFSTNGNLPSWIGVWIPNFIFAIIAFILYKRAPK